MPLNIIYSHINISFHCISLSLSLFSTTVIIAFIIIWYFRYTHWCHHFHYAIGYSFAIIIINNIRILPLIILLLIFHYTQPIVLRLLHTLILHNIVSFNDYYYITPLNSFNYHWLAHWYYTHISCRYYFRLRWLILNSN